MMNRNENQDQAPRQNSRDDVRKEYSAPTLTEHGSLEAITKGGVDPVPPLGWLS